MIKIVSILLSNDQSFLCISKLSLYYYKLLSLNNMSFSDVAVVITKVLESFEFEYVSTLSNKRHYRYVQNLVIDFLVKIRNKNLLSSNV